MEPHSLQHAFDCLIRRRLHELEILQNIDRELNRNLDLDAVLHTILKLGHERVPAEEASILLPNYQTQTLEVVVAVGPHAESRRSFVIPLLEGKGITCWVLQHKQPVRVDDICHERPWQGLFIPALTDIASELAVPLLDGDEVIGVLNFESTKECAFGQEDELFLTTLAGQAVLAIKKAQAYEREKRFAAEGQVLNEISKEIISHLNPAYVLDLILEKALELTRSTRGILMLYDPEQNDLRMVAERGVSEDKKGLRISLAQGIIGHVARTKQVLNIKASTQYRPIASTLE